MRFNWQGLIPHTLLLIFHILLEGKIILQRTAVSFCLFYKKSEALNSHYDALCQCLTGGVPFRAHFLYLDA